MNGALARTFRPMTLVVRTWFLKCGRVLDQGSRRATHSLRLPPGPPAISGRPGLEHPSRSVTRPIKSVTVRAGGPFPWKTRGFAKRRHRPTNAAQAGRSCAGLCGQSCAVVRLVKIDRCPFWDDPGGIYLRDGIIVDHVVARRHRAGHVWHLI